jgi:hypothetical protein
VVVLAASRHESGRVAHALLELEAEDAAVELEGSIDVRHLQMDVPDVDARIDRQAGQEAQITHAHLSVSRLS